MRIFREILNALIQKGLRLHLARNSEASFEILNALIQKGLRPSPTGICSDSRNTECPDSKGIKTHFAGLHVCSFEILNALIQKGLRLFFHLLQVPRVEILNALIQKGLRPCAALHQPLQH